MQGLATQRLGSSGSVLRPAFSSPSRAHWAGARSSRHGHNMRALVPAGRLQASRDTVVPAPSLNVPLGLLAISGLATYEGVQPVAWVAGVLGLFLTIQSTRVRFQFGPEELEVVIGETEEKTENRFVGGENRWRYDTFINWEMWWPGFPILVYFKETQTKPEGQIHFFPVLFDGKALYDVMVERCGRTQNSGPKA